MEELARLALPAAVGFAAGGVCVVLVVGWLNSRPARTRRVSRAERRAAAGSVLEAVCTVCQRRFVAGADDLRELVAAEKALVVASRPSVVGMRLVAFECPYCETEHCFVRKGADFEHVGADICEPGRQGALCIECRKVLATPHSGLRHVDGDADDLDPDMGLVCGRCGAHACVACCRSATRSRTADASLLCPRCFRGPVRDVFSP